MTDAKVATYFIGNGFDLNIGLDTSYSSFLKWYTEQSEFYFLYHDEEVRKNERFGAQSYVNVINDFRTRVLKDKERWADLELALGKATTDNLFSPQVIDRMNNAWNTGEEIFFACKYDLDWNLRCYLLNQNRRFDNCKIGESSRLFMESMLEEVRGRGFGDFGLRARNHYYDYDKLNLVSFNYTDVVARMFNYHVIPIEGLGVPAIVGSKYKETEVEYIQIHGNLDRSFTLGVDNVGQIKSDYHKDNNRSRSALLKPEMIDSYARGRLEDMIDKTDVFFIFGMSIGETDKTWWKKIGEQLSINSEDKKLIIYSYNENYDSEPTYAQQRYIDSVKNRFCELADLSVEEGGVISDRIFVYINTHMFDFPELNSQIKASEKVTVPKNLCANVTVIPKQKP